MITEAVLGKLLVGVVGAIVFCIGLISITKRRRNLKEGIEVEGKIVDYKVYMSNSWAYICTFTLPDGQQVTAVDSVSSSNTGLQNLWKKKRGEKLRIIYNKKNPGKFSKKNEIGLEAGFYLMMLTGIAFVLLAVFVI